MQTDSRREAPRRQPGSWRHDEQALKAWVAAVLWIATTAGIIAASYIDQVAPEHVGAWRLALTTFVLLMSVITLALSRLISAAAFQLFIELSMIPALAVNVILLQLTPATEAVLFNLIFTLVFAGYYLRRTAMLLTLIGFIVVALSTLFTDPARDTLHLGSFLVVYVATIVLTVSFMHIQNSERIDALGRLRRRGLTDPLTELGNLRALRDAARRALSRQDLKRHQEEVLGLIVIDLENFKAANSRYGHIGGDHALRQVAEQMQRVAPADSLVARIGGDEFAVLLREESTARLAERAEIFRGAVRAGSSIMEMPGVELDAVVGIAVHPADGRDLDELMGVANRRLYDKKGAKRHLVPNLDRAQIASDEPPPWLSSEPGEVDQPELQRVEQLLDLITGGKHISFLASRTIFSRTAALAWLVGCAILTISLLMPDAYPDPKMTWWMVLAAGIIPVPALLLINAEPGGAAHLVSDVAAYLAIFVAIWATGGINSPVTPLLVLHVANQALFWDTRMLSFRLIAPVLVALSPLLYTSLTTSQADVIELLRIYATSVLLFAIVLAMYINRVLLARMQRVAEELATHDPLTGITNRRAFNSYVQLQIATPTTEQFAIVMIDLDNFKRVNSEHGHQAGDQVLTAIAQSLASVSRNDDCVARIGGDEFAAVLPGVGEDGARELAQRLVSAAAGCDAAREYGIGASAGFALWPHHGSTLDQLVFTADSALMAVKATGEGSAGVAAVVSAVS